MAFTLDNCVFPRGCSFQRITLFVGAPEYPAVKDNGILNWITRRPSSIAAASAQPSLPIPQSSSPPQTKSSKAPVGSPVPTGLG